MQFDWFQFSLGSWIFIYIALIVFAIGIFTTLWVIIHVEYGERFSPKKTAIGIIILSLCLGISTHLFLLYLGL
ncbi:MAG: hypothetical protein ACP6IU_02665 [Candidatus Asgardarchaeia archaeon]